MTPGISNGSFALQSSLPSFSDLSSGPAGDLQSRIKFSEFPVRLVLALCLLLPLSSPLIAQRQPDPGPSQHPAIHDPSTVIFSDGMYYVFGTGRGAPILTSPDSVTWTRAGSVFTQIPADVMAGAPGNNGTDVWAPDIIALNGKFYLYYAVSSWGSFVSAVGLATNTTLNPKDPAYAWTDRGIVVQSAKGEALNAIDPGVIHAPDGTLWLCYGSYHGTIQLIELAPTGLRLHPEQKATVIASASESSDIIAHDGYFYLFVDHGSCCKGKDSAYNLRVGRSRMITGPYLDKHGEDMARGAGSLFLAAHDHRIGPGHFGRIIEDGAERFSMHYEADTDIGGRSILDIRPLLWSADGWPIAGDHLAAGAYQIRSSFSENVVEIHLDTPPVPARGQPASTAPFTPKPPVLRLGKFVTLDDQKWTIAPVEGVYSKILNVATGDTLQVPAGASGTTAVAFAPYTGTDTQLWALEQMPDASYRIRNKASKLVLTAPAAKADPVFENFTPGALLASPFVRDDRHTWIITAP